MERYTEYKSAEDRDAAWIARAVKFSAFILVNSIRVHDDFGTLREAAIRASTFERQCAEAGMPEKRALVYAITADDHTAMVPRADWLRAAI